MKIGKYDILIDHVNFVIWTSMLPLKNHDFSRLFLKTVKIHELFMTIQVSDSDSGLFRFIHDCGNPASAISLSRVAFQLQSEKLAVSSSPPKLPSLNYDCLRT